MEENLSTFVLRNQDFAHILSREEDKQFLSFAHNDSSEMCLDSFDVASLNQEKPDDNCGVIPSVHTKLENDFSSFAYISARESEAPKTLENTFTPYNC